MMSVLPRLPTRLPRPPRRVRRPAVMAVAALLVAALAPVPAARAQGPASAGEAPGRAGDILRAPIEMREAGIYCPAEHVGTEPAPDTESGYILITEDNPELVLSSRVVPAYLGLSFGINIRLAPGAAPGPYRLTVRHPPTGPRGVTRESWNPALDGRWGVRSFNFEFERELVTGPWTFELHRGDELLLRQGFEVVPPMAAPEAIGLCFGDSFVS